MADHMDMEVQVEPETVIVSPSGERGCGNSEWATDSAGAALVAKKRKAVKQRPQGRSERSKASRRDYSTPSSHPPAVMALVTKLLGSCPPALRNEVAEKFDIDPNLFKTVSNIAQLPMESC